MSDAPAGGSVTVWLDRLKAGDQAAAGPLWVGYFARLVALAHVLLVGPAGRGRRGGRGAVGLRQLLPRGGRRPLGAWSKPNVE